ncbi:receptor-type tyrosine-protein phosphatase beta-like [Hyla sarda]|uniref:receptor-type tyrosine-protein phosphatase beta-like n=1 Tax=Hyla sarda TaxID=327740 RepID=UPI0024C25EDE|nr:receptor-type tyrosine-protein phosphatase beta-like [Hyla sarda]
MYVSWSLPEGNRSSYLVEVIGDPSQRFTVYSESATITNLTSGIQYTVRITTVAGNGLHGGGKEISVLVADNITATLITTTAVWLNWDPYVGENSSYNISIYGEPSSTWTVNTTELQITNLTSGNLYRIQVSAYENDELLFGYGGEISLYTRPGIVRNVQVSDVSINSMNLSWFPPESNYSQYFIEVTGDVNMNDTTISQSLAVTGLTPGNQYTVTIRTVTGTDVFGDPTVLRATTRPDIVKNLTIVNTTATSVCLSWLPPEGYASSYIIEVLDNATINTNVTTNLVTIENLTPGKYYTFRVFALAGQNAVKGDGYNITANTMPDLVKILTIVTVTTTSVSLSWLPPEGYTSSYMIEVLENSTLNMNVTSTSVTIENLISGNFYTFMISALTDDNKIKGESNSISVYAKPEVVQNLMTGIITTTSISLSWEKPEGNTSFYEIQIVGEPTFIKTVTTTSDTIEGLIPGNYYILLVTAVVGENNITGNSSQISVYTKPEAVKNLSAVNITTTSFSLNWLPPEGGVSAYQILINERLISTLNTNYTVEGLTPGNVYTVVVSTLVSDIQGEGSKIEVTTKPEAVKNLSAVNITTTSFSLNWLPPEGGVSAYQILINGRLISTLNTNYTVEGLSPGNVYTVVVSTLVSDMQGEDSKTEVTTKSGAVKNLSAVNITTTSFSLNWLPPEGGVSTYQILINGRLISTLNTNYTVEGLPPGNVYTIVVSTLIGDIQGDGSKTEVTTKPGAVKNLSAVHITTTSFSLNWLPPEGGVSAYQILLNGRLISTLNTNYTFEGLSPGNVYTVVVSTLVSDIQGEGSKTEVTTKPGAVKSLSAVNITTTSFSLNWLPPEGGVSTYQILINGRLISTLNTNYTVEGLSPGNVYTIMVSTLIGDIQGEGSKTEVTTKPGAVKNLSAVNITTTSFSLNWLPPEGGVSAYQILINGRLISTLNTNYTVEGLSPGNVYTVVVSTLVSDIQGEGSKTEVTTKPGAVKSLSAVNITTTSFSLNWLPPEGGVSTYQILINGRFISTLNTNYTVEGLSPGNVYTIMVSTLIGDIQGEGSKTEVTTKPGAVKNLSAVNITTTSFSLNWLPPEGGVNAYQILLNGRLISTLNTNYTVEGLSPGNVYTVVVSTLIGDIQGEGSKTEVTTKPGAVKNLSAVNITTTSFSLNWLPPEGGVSAYQILINGRLISTLNTNFTVEGLSPGNVHTVVVSTLVSDIQGEDSKTEVTTKPGAVKNLSAVNITTTSFSLNWLPPEGGVSAYQILLNGRLISTLNTNYTVEGLSPGNVYTIVVSTLIGYIQGEGSKTEVTTKPGAVKNLSAVNITTTSFSLNWLPPEGGVSAYQILINGRLISTLNTNYTVEGLSPGNVYTVVVSTLVSDMQGEDSKTEVTTKPGAVKNLSAVNITTTSFSLNWLPPEGGVSAYQILINGRLISTLNTNYTFEGLSPGNVYTVVVSTLVSDIQGEDSKTEVTTKPGAVKNLSAVNITTISFSLNWLPPEGGVSAYQILINGSLISTLNTNYTIEGLSPGNVYTVVVSTLIGDIQGEGSKTEVSTKPGAVKNLSAVNITTTSFSLNWLPPEGGVSTYQILINGRLISTLNTNYTVEDLSPGNVYTVVVSTLIGDIQGEGSKTEVTTNANSLFLSLTISSSDPNNRILIINKINDFLKKQFPNKNVTAVWKQSKIMT